MSSRLFSSVVLVVLSLLGLARAQGVGEIDIVAQAVVTEADATKVSFFWIGVASRYQVQSSDTLPAAWTPEMGELRSTTATVSADSEVTRRFYRVVAGDAVISHEITSPLPGAQVVAGSV